MPGDSVPLREYVEAILREKDRALTIKETADQRAIELDQELQRYKNEKANELREQISSERGLYATKVELDAAVERLREMQSQSQKLLIAFLVAVLVSTVALLIRSFGV